ncbi:D-glycero-beta-D-manno-heptose 1-phosphate adenylyltransferase [Kutzneria sp. NPDC052558]|uniref:D-glycero-beta-D-manno-heptose 1-phosphate adenylyltransferase n=1 Tax=Kutzneria sp. NPDC052558 TaxID=3364121 RepID=UPI0037CB261A
MLTPDTPDELARRRLRIAVVGDAMLDGWLCGDSNRLCREAPAPVVEITSAVERPGGAANTAANLAALGAEAVLIAVTGADPDGARLRRELDAAGVRTEAMLVEHGRRTMAKRRIVAGAQLIARFDEGDTGAVRPSTGRALAGVLCEVVPRCDAVLVCDYGAGTLTDAVRAELVRLRTSMPLLVADAHDLRPWAAVRPDVVTPNAGEAARLLGATWTGDGRSVAVENRADDLRAATGADAVVVTLDRDGAVLLPPDGPVHRTWAQPAPESQASGAGDTFVAALTTALAGGLPAPVAVEFAQAAADVVVGRPGTSVCTTAQLTERLGGFRAAVLNHDELAGAVSAHRAAGRRIVFTNGCFDVLHRGHVAYLNQAKRLGDVLVVAVNDDSGVRRLKGPGRPVNSASDRAAVLAALSCVDHVTTFGADTTAGLITRLRPEVYAKGGDYTPEMLPETPTVRACGGEVRILDYLPDRSTTAVINRIRAEAGAPGRR